MTTPFVVDLDGLTQLLDDIAAFDGTVAGQVSDLDGEMTALHGTWTGSAAAAQSQAHARLLDGVAAMRAGLLGMRKAGATAHGNYSAAVTTNQAMFDGLG